MTAVLITYDVDDVQAWLASPTRTSTFESAGFTVRPFVDPAVANQVALLVERRQPAAGRATLVAPYRPVRGSYSVMNNSKPRCSSVLNSSSPRSARSNLDS